MCFFYFSLAKNPHPLAVTLHLLKLQLSFIDFIKLLSTVGTEVLQGVKLNPSTRCASLFLMQLNAIQKSQGALFGFMK